MAVAERSLEPVRGHKAIGIPCAQQEYERAVGDPGMFRMLLDQQIKATPELFPPVSTGATA